LRLVDELQLYTREYASAANNLAGRMGTLSTAKYKAERSAVEIARLKAEQAREALLGHIDKHGCKSG
jgi:hypothetical protein